VGRYRTYNLDGGDVVRPGPIIGSSSYDYHGLVQELARAGTITSFSASYNVHYAETTSVTLHVRLFSDDGRPADGLHPVPGVGCDVTIPSSTASGEPLSCRTTGLAAAVSTDERMVVVATLTAPPARTIRSVTGYLTTSIVVR
jgi:hypothetical protein